MKKLVALTGAGISAESGLKTFRDNDGMWEDYKIEEVATPGAWIRNPGLVLKFYNVRRKAVIDAVPNLAHRILASLQDIFEVQIITQNIDDLHERAGSKNVLHLHGSILSMRSELNPSIKSEIRSDMLLGALAPDGSPWRPDIVWFDEPVPAIESAIKLVSSTDIFLIVGTSLVVYPAAGLLDIAPPHCPKYIIDKKIPCNNHLHNINAIEANASDGMKLFEQKLRSGQI